MTEQVTTLERVETYVPDPTVTVEQAAAAMGMNRHQARMFRRIRGLDRMRWDPEQSVFDLVQTPALALLRSVPDKSVIRFLIFAHTFQDLSPSYQVAVDELAVRLGLGHAETFAITQQNCASGLAALDIAGELLDADGDPRARALVLTGEKPFTRIVRLIVNTSIMGEAASAALVGLNGPGSRVRSYAVKTVGQYSDGFRLSGEPLREFGNTYNTHLAEVMQQALDQGGLTLDDIDMVVPHNVNLSSWLRLAAKLGLPRERLFLDNVGEYSHCFCTDPFLNLGSLRERGRLRKGGLYLVTTVGLGATYAAMVIEY